MKKQELQEQAAQLSAAVKGKMADLSRGSISAAEFKSFMEKAESENREIEVGLKNWDRAMAYRAGGELNEPVAQFGMKGSGRQVAPLNFDVDALQALHMAATSRQSLQIKTPSFSTVLPLGQQLPGVLGPVHEGRLLDHLPAQATSAPSVEYIRHVSTTGVPEVVGEGNLKPALVFNTDRVACTPVKIAAHVGASHESLEDFPSFAGYIQQELTSQLIDVENDELLNGSGLGHIHGLGAAGGLVHDAADDASALDAIEASIAELRVGSALATANLLVLSPTTWSAIRRSKDLQLRYMVTADPTQGEANTVWGVPVLVTTALEDGTGILLDTQKFGFVLVREAISIRTTTSGDDPVYNIQRFIAEERIGLAIERPTAVMKISNLPTTTPGS